MAYETAQAAKPAENFKDVDNVEDANMMDLKAWKFCGFNNGIWHFARRAKQLE